MAEIVKLINSIDGWTLTRDVDFSLLNKSITNPWVIEWLLPNQNGGAGTDITVWTGEALVKVTRTSVTPNEVFYVVFRNTVEKVLTVWNNKKIFIEIESVNINTPSNNTSPTGQNIWSIKIADDYPTDNFLKLWETDWSWLLSTDVFEFQTIKQDVLNKSTYSASSTWTDSYAITIPGITTYQDGMTFKVKADVSNTGSCTLDVNGLWAKAVKKQQGTVDLIDGDWWENGIGTVVYNSDLDCFQFEGETINLPSPEVFPKTTYVSWDTTPASSTVFTFTHNLWLTQEDVINCKYEVFLCVKNSANLWKIYWLRNTAPNRWGSSFETHEWNTYTWNVANPTQTGQVHFQENTVKIYTWSAFWWDINFNLIIQQIY